MYNYTREHLRYIKKAARTEAGAQDPDRKRLPPRAVFITEVNRSQMNNMMKLCFDNHFQLTTYEHGRLTKLAECCLAYLFIMLEQWVTTYGRDHISVKVIIENAVTTLLHLQ